MLAFYCLVVALLLLIIERVTSAAEPIKRDNGIAIQHAYCKKQFLQNLRRNQTTKVVHFIR